MRLSAIELSCYLWIYLIFINLSNHHRDPFDRLLISQSQSEKLVIVSIDAKFDGYEIERLW